MNDEPNDNENNNHTSMQEAETQITVSRRKKL